MTHLRFQIAIPFAMVVVLCTAAMSLAAGLWKPVYYDLRSLPLWGVAARSSRQAIGVGEQGVVARTFDGGRTFTRTQIDPAAFLLSAAYIDSLRVIVFDTAGTAWLSTDAGGVGLNLDRPMQIDEEVALEPADKYETDLVNDCGEALKVIEEVGTKVVAKTVKKIEEKLGKELFEKAKETLGEVFKSGIETGVEKTLTKKTEHEGPEQEGEE